MLSRRHIRLKVMQSLYAHFSNNENRVSTSEKLMLNHFQEIGELNLVILSLIVELVKYADNFFEEGKKKHLPKEEDLYPNRRFTDNQVIKLIRDDANLMDQVNKASGIWLNNDHYVVRKLFKQLYQSELYISYIAKEDDNIEVDQRFFVNALNDYILNNELVHHIFEERSIYWVDDLPFVATIIMGNIKSASKMTSKSIFKDNSDKTFALQLFRNTINNNKKYESIIVKFAKNWELDRIATMDQLFLKMAFSEILTMDQLPVKVTMNEYIEISKYYSTAKSKLFVNGLLDNAVKYFNEQGLIKKVGKGLM